MGVMGGGQARWKAVATAAFFLLLCSVSPSQALATAVPTEGAGNGSWLRYSHLGFGYPLLVSDGRRYMAYRSRVPDMVAIRDTKRGKVRRVRLPTKSSRGCMPFGASHGDVLVRCGFASETDRWIVNAKTLKVEPIDLSGFPRSLRGRVSFFVNGIGRRWLAGKVDVNPFSVVNFYLNRTTGRVLTPSPYPQHSNLDRRRPGPLRLPGALTKPGDTVVAFADDAAAVERRRRNPVRLLLRVRGTAKPVRLIRDYFRIPPGYDYRYDPKICSPVMNDNVIVWDHGGSGSPVRGYAIGSQRRFTFAHSGISKVTRGGTCLAVTKYEAVLAATRRGGNMRLRSAQMSDIPARSYR